MTHLPVWPKSELQVATIRPPHVGDGKYSDLWKYLLIYLIFPLFSCVYFTALRTVKKETIVGSALLELVLYNLALLPNCQPLEIKKKKIVPRS